MESNERAAAEQAEQFESIPWSALTQGTDSSTRKYVVIALLAMAGALVGFLGGRVLRGGSSPGVVVTLPPVAAAEPVAAAVADDPPPVSTTAAVPTSPAVLLPQLYSEADLMAVLPEEEMRLAVLRAEWFVRDYFTAGGPWAPIDDVLNALPDDVVSYPLPHLSDSGLSHVEWASAFLVDPAGPATYRVSVAFRTLSGGSPSSLRRLPVRAVSVTVEVAADGASAVLDYPAPVLVPGDLSVEVAVPAEAELPGDVRDAALAAAGSVGGDPKVMSAGVDDDGWRVVVMVGDESGLRWPVAVRP